MIHSPLKVVFFDAAGTLFRLRESVGLGYARIGRELGIHLEPDVANRAFHEAWRLAPAACAADLADPERAWWRDLVARVVDSCGEPMNDGYFDALWAHYEKADTWELFEETVEVLQQLLARGLRLGVISNFDRRLLSILDGLGIAGFFDPVVISADVGARKPSPKIYQTALDVAGCLPGEALHAGDEAAADWNGAAAVGMRVFELRRPENTLLDLIERIHWRAVQDSSRYPS